MRTHHLIPGLLTIALAAAGTMAAESRPADPDKSPHIVLLAGEPEYHSDRTLEGLARELTARYGLRTTLLKYKNDKDFPGLEKLREADLVVFYLRFLTLPDEQMAHIRAYLDSGRPVVAIRTSTHAFLNWKDFAPQVLGTPWWQFHYGHSSSSDVRIIPERAKHPILRGVDESFHVRSWLYYVHPLHPKAVPLMVGTSVKPERENPVENPVAWTFEHKGGRVFYTSMGHPEDFELKPFRTLLINGIFWALDREPPATAPSK